MSRLAGLVNTGGWADLKWIDAMCAITPGLAGVSWGGPTRAFLVSSEKDGYRSRDRNEIGSENLG
jgi:hypothetical protein